MKKVKMMLLSLALFAVVGGALAFKAKFINTWCTTDAYFDTALGYYCDFTPVGGTKTTTTCGAASVLFRTTDLAQGAVQKVCTTNTQAGQHPCAKVCNQLISVTTNQ